MCGYKPERNNVRVRNNANSNNIITTATAVIPYDIILSDRSAAVGRENQSKNSVKSPSRTGCILLLLLLLSNSATVLHVCLDGLGPLAIVSPEKSEKTAVEHDDYYTTEKDDVIILL